MGDIIYLQESRVGVVPVREGHYRDLAPNPILGPRPPVDFASNFLPRLSKESIDGGSADRKQALPDRWFKVQVAMVLQGLEQERNKGLETFATDPVLRLPQNHQGLPDGLIVDGLLGSSEPENSFGRIE